MAGAPAATVTPDLRSVLLAVRAEHESLVQCSRPHRAPEGGQDTDLPGRQRCPQHRRAEHEQPAHQGQVEIGADIDETFRPSLYSKFACGLVLRDAPTNAFQSAHIGAGALGFDMAIALSRQTSIGVVFHTSRASAMSMLCRFSIDAASQEGNASNFSLILEIDVFCPTLVSSTKLRVR